MTERRSSLDTVLDVLVYAPVGLAAEARRVLPDLAREGRTRVDQRVNLARFVGRLAVRTGRQRLDERLASLRATTAPSAPSESAVETAAASTPPSVPVSSSAPKSASPAVDAASTSDVTAAELPIVGYDTLSASQVVSRLAALGPDELAAVAEYERSHRQRRTVLGKVEQLRSRVA